MGVDASSLPKKYQDQIYGQLASKALFAPVAARLPDVKPKSDSGKTLERPASGKAQGIPRLTLRIVRRSLRPLDADNFAGGCKSLIDQIRYQKLIPNDDPYSVRLEFEQEKVSKRTEEGTEIIICRSPNPS